MRRTRPLLVLLLLTLGLVACGEDHGHSGNDHSGNGDHQMHNEGGSGASK